VANEVVSKEVTAQVVKWGFWAVMVLMGAGLVSVANRNVYSKEEVDAKFKSATELQEERNRALYQKLNQIEQQGYETQKLVIQLIRERP